MNQYQPPQYVYYAPVRPPSNGMAVTALVMGIIAITFGIWSPVPFFGLVAASIAFVPGVLAVIFGHVGLNASASSRVGRGQSITGLVLGYVTVGLIVITTIGWIAMLTASSGSWA